MRVLMIVQQLDDENWLRRFIVDWVRSLAQYVDHLYVLALELGTVDLPANVTALSMGKEKDYSRPQELAAFYSGVWRTIPKVDVIFSHMTPRYSWLAAPLALGFRKPQLLWFIHPKANAEIRLALWCVRWIATATPESFPIHSHKVHAMGHGIDEHRFSPAASRPPQDPPLVLAVGRLSPIKGHHVLLEVAKHLPDIQFAIAGHLAAPADQTYQEQLLARREELGITPERFRLLGGLSPDSLVDMLRRAAVATNLTPPGSFDKAALEAMLTATPLMTANTAFDDLLAQDAQWLKLSTHTDAQAIAQKLQAFLALSPKERSAMGARLRKRTAAQHGLDRLMRELVALMQT